MKRTWWLCFMLCLLIGCNEPKNQIDTHPPVTETPTPTVNQIQFEQLTNGYVEFEVTGLDKLWTHGDDFVLLLLTGEMTGLDKSLPVCGIHVRGTNPQNAGIVIRQSANIGSDKKIWKENNRNLPPELDCGNGMEYNARVVGISDGLWKAWWDDTQICALAPTGAQTCLPVRRPRSVMFGMAHPGVPYTQQQGRYHLWTPGHDATQNGVSVKIKVFRRNGTQTAWKPCPVAR